MLAVENILLPKASMRMDSLSGGVAGKELVLNLLVEALYHRLSSDER